MKKSSRILSFVLAALMVMTALPVSAMADGVRNFAVNGIKDLISGIGSGIAAPGFLDDVNYPAQTLTVDTGDGLTVTVEAPEGALPERAAMTAARVSDIEAVQAAVDQADDVSGTVLTAVDITFYNKKGKEIQPRQAVTVTITSAVFNGRKDITVVHIDVDADELGDRSADAELVANAGIMEDTVTFSARHFSVYAVIGDGSTGETKLLTVNFYEPDGTTLINKQVIRMDQIPTMLSNGNTIVYDPGVPSLASNEAFTGWDTTTPGSTYVEGIEDMTVEDITDYIVANYSNWNNGHTLNYIAQVYEVVFVFYCDQYGAICKSEPHAVGSSFTYYSGDTPAVPTGTTGNYGVIGWLNYNDRLNSNVEKEGAKSGEGTDYMLPEYKTGAAAEAATRPAGAQATLTSELILFPYIGVGHWLSFDSNIGTLDDTRATFTAPVFVEHGAAASSKKPADPTRPGYTFDKWYTDANCTTAYDWSSEVNTDGVILYAGWTAKDVSYSVVFWQQNVTDSVNATNAQKTYSYYESDNTRTAKAGTYVQINTATTGTTADNRLGGNSTTSIGKMGYYFTYNSTNSDTGRVLVKGDGTTVLNVRYDRRTITINFYSGFTRSSSYTSSLTNGGWYYIRYSSSYVLVKYQSSNGYLYDTSDNAYSPSSYTCYYANPTNVTTYTGLYEAPFGTWPSAGSGYRWFNLTSTSNPGVTNYSMSIPADAYKQWILLTSDSTSTTWNLVKIAFSQSSPRTVTIKGQDTDGNYTVDLGESLLDSGAIVTFTNELFTGYVMDHVTYSGYTYDVSSKTQVKFGHGGYSSYSSGDYDYLVPSGGATIYYSRLKFDIDYVTGGDPIDSQSVFYGKVLTSYEADDPTGGPTGYYFKDWYKNPECTEEFNWNETMPLHNLAAYAKWNTEWYRVVFDVTGNGKVPADSVTVPGTNQAITFTVEYGKKVQGSSLNGITTSVPGYTFGGWYYDAACTIPFSMDTAMTPNLTNVDPGYRNTSKTGTDAFGVAWDDSPYPDVRYKLTLYAYWRAAVTGAAGISVIYDAISGQGIIKTPYPAEVIKADPLLYTNGATAFGRYAATPIDSQGNDDENRQFLYWEIRDQQGNVLHKVYPGQPFPIKLEWAVESQSYTITWNYRNASGAEVSDTTKVAEGMMPTHANPPSYTSGSNFMVFAGWSPALEAVHSDATYTAQYEVGEEIYYTVTYVDGYNNNTISTEQVVVGGYPQSVPNFPAHDNMRPTGWTMGSDTTLLTSAEVANTAINGDTTFTAQYENAGYTVTFDANGGTFTSGTTVVRENVASGTKISDLFPETDPTNATSGRYFYGWFTLANGGEEIDDDTVTGNITVYAHWYTESWQTVSSLTKGKVYAITHTSGSTRYAITYNGADQTLTRTTFNASNVSQNQMWYVGGFTDNDSAYWFESVAGVYASPAVEAYFGINSDYDLIADTDTSEGVYAFTISDNYLYLSSYPVYYGSGTYYLTSSTGTSFTFYQLTATDINAGSKSAASDNLGRFNDLARSGDMRDVCLTDPFGGTRSGMRATTDKYELVSGSTLTAGKYLITFGSNTYRYVVSAPNIYSSNYVAATSCTLTLGSDNYYTSSADLSGYLFTVTGTTSSWMNTSGTYFAQSSGNYTTYSSTAQDWTWNGSNLFNSSNYGIYWYSDHVELRSGSSDTIYLYKLVESTTPTTYTVSAVSNNTSYGTIATPASVENIASGGSASFTAVPANGYQVTGVSVNPTTAATASYSGNDITVTNVTANCTVTVTFAAIPATYTVTYVSNGTQVGTDTTVNGSVNLPGSVTNAPEGYTFIGWSTTEVSDTTTQPTVLTGTYTPTGNVTLYAVFSYTAEGGSTETVYQLLTATPADWAGRYVITSGTDTSMYVLKGISGNTSYESTSAGGTVTYANSGMTLDGNMLRNVGNAYIFNAAAVSGGYSLQNASTSTYMGSYNSYLYSRSTYSSSYCVWALEYDASNACMKVSNSASSNYPYMVMGNSYFVINSTYTTNKTQFWRETTISSGTTHYTTGETPATTYTVTAQVSGGNGSITSTNPVTGIEENGTATFTAAPNTGYELGTVTVSPTGAATVTTSGNTITVSGVTDNCTVTVTFNAIAVNTHTITYYANGTQYQTENVAEGSHNLLSTAPAVDGYTFVGWVGSAVEDTTTAPTHYTPGESVNVTGDMTLHALYTHVDGATGENVYVLVEESLSDWTGNYVITYGAAPGTTPSYVMKGVTPSSNGAQIESTANTTAFASSGIVQNGTQLSNVAEDYVFAMAQRGSYYSVLSTKTGCFVGETTDGYLGGYTTYTATYCDWTPGTGANASSMTSAFTSGGYPYLSFSTSNSYFWSGSTNNSYYPGVRLWKETPVGTTYYTTDTSALLKLTINYELPEGYAMPEGYSTTYEAYYENGESYSVESPEIEGLTPNTAVVSGTMNGQNVTVTVTYSENTKHTVTVNYVNGDTNETFMTQTAEVAEGAHYAINSPSVPGYTPDVAVVEGDMGNQNVTVTVTYNANEATGDKTYTIYLYAVYGRANKTGKTHITWYSNDDMAAANSGGDAHYDEELEINEATHIPTPENFYTAHTVNGDIVTLDGAVLEWEHHVFLGWARVDADNNLPNGTAHHELNEDNLYLKYVDGVYKAQDSGGNWVTVTQVAADEMQPYHDMYAVWASVFYVYHSGNNEVDRIVSSTKAGTYDLTENLAPHTLYGGYYSSYTGMGSGFEAKGLSWASVSADNLTRGRLRQTTLQSGVVAEDTTGKAYITEDATLAWDWDNAYTANGQEIAPVAGRTYYIKEVPDTMYLQPYMHYTYKLTGVITAAWLISDLDDLNYQETGFLIATNGNEARVASSLTIQTSGISTSVTLTVPKVFKKQNVQSGWLSYLQVYGPNSSNLFTSGGGTYLVRQYWRTPDGLYVTGTVRRMYQNFGTINVTKAEDLIPSTIGLVCN